MTPTSMAQLRVVIDDMATRLQRWAPKGVDKWAWARDRLAHLSAWHPSEYEGEGAVDRILDCLSVGTVDGGRVHGLPVSPMAVGWVCLHVPQVARAYWRMNEGRVSAAQ